MKSSHHDINSKLNSHNEELITQPLTEEQKEDAVADQCVDSCIDCCGLLICFAWCFIQQPLSGFNCARRCTAHQCVDADDINEDVPHPYHCCDAISSMRYFWDRLNADPRVNVQAESSAQESKLTASPTRQ